MRSPEVAFSAETCASASITKTLPSAATGVAVRCSLRLEPSPKSLRQATLKSPPAARLSIQAPGAPPAWGQAGTGCGSGMKKVWPLRASETSSFWLSAIRGIRSPCDALILFADFLSNGLILEIVPQPASEAPRTATAASANSSLDFIRRLRSGMGRSEGPPPGARAARPRPP